MHVQICTFCACQHYVNDNIPVVKYLQVLIKLQNDLKMNEYNISKKQVYFVTVIT